MRFGGRLSRLLAPKIARGPSRGSRTPEALGGAPFGGLQPGNQDLAVMLTTILYLLFVLSALLLISVVLIQEGKGGGLGDAFGGAGQQTFGVGAKGITRFTSYVAVAFVVLAVAITLVEKEQGGSVIGDGGGSSVLNAPADQGEE